MKFFNATEQDNTLRQGTAGAVAIWITQFVNILFPENGVEYWFTQRYLSPKDLDWSQPMPSPGLKDGDVHHVACYVYTGSSEGFIFTSDLVLRNGAHKTLCSAKFLGGEDEVWLIARAVNQALDSIIFYGEVPAIVDMATKLPRAQKWHRESSLNEEITISATDEALHIRTRTGKIPAGRLDSVGC